MSLSTADVPVSDRIGSRAGRRRSVVGLYAGFLALGVGQLAGGNLRVAGGVIAIAGVAAMIAAFGHLMRRTLINAPQISSTALDERWRARRDRATWIASLFNSIVLALFAAYATITTTLVPAWTSVGVLTYALWAAALLTMTLPTAIMAWTEPDPLREDA